MKMVRETGSARKLEHRHMHTDLPCECRAPEVAHEQGSKTFCIVGAHVHEHLRNQVHVLEDLLLGCGGRERGRHVTARARTRILGFTGCVDGA